MFVVTHLRERESRLEDASARTARATPTLQYCEGLQPTNFPPAAILTHDQQENSPPTCLS